MFVVDESAAGGGGNKVGSGLAAYPGEKPTKAELIKWLQASRDSKSRHVRHHWICGPFLRGEVKRPSLPIGLGTYNQGNL